MARLVGSHRLRWVCWGEHLIIAMLRNLARAGRRHAYSAIIVALAVVLAGCATRPGPELLVPVATAPGVKTQPIYVATTRKRAAPSENVFTAEPANTLNFAKFVVAVPPNHQPGHIEWPEGTPDSRVSFATIDQVGSDRRRVS